MEVMRLQAEEVLNKLRYNGFPSAEINRICWWRGIRITVPSSEYNVYHREPLFMVLNRRVDVPFFYDGTGKNEIKVHPRNKKESKVIIEVTA